MSSPAKGRGRGIRTSPRKAFLQPSEERNFSQASPQPHFSQSYEQPHFSQSYEQPHFSQGYEQPNFSHPSEEPNLLHASRQPNLSLAAQEPNFLQSSLSLGRGRGMRQSPRKTFLHASRQANFSSQEVNFLQASPQTNQTMLSPSRGRGRGIRTSPRKAFSQLSQQPYGLQHSQPYFSQPSQQPYTKTIDRAKWTSPSIKSLLEACAEEIEENGRALNGFSKQAWARIVNAVMGKTGKKFEKKQLKDKHDRLKDEWRAWILIAEDKRQTGLGRNPETGAITDPITGGKL